LAAIMVLVAHVRAASFVEYGALPQEQKSVLVAAIFAASRLGLEAALVFFVLSGFLVGGQRVRTGPSISPDMPQIAARAFSFRWFRHVC
jgi:peptidoglycan/LPS O-acetylase OafA/YrhL